MTLMLVCINHDKARYCIIFVFFVVLFSAIARDTYLLNIILLAAAM